MPLRSVASCPVLVQLHPAPPLSGLICRSPSLASSQGLRRWIRADVGACLGDQNNPPLKILTAPAHPTPISPDNSNKFRRRRPLQRMSAFHFQVISNKCVTPFAAVPKETGRIFMLFHHVLEPRGRYLYFEAVALAVVLSCFWAPCEVPVIQSPRLGSCFIMFLGR